MSHERRQRLEAPADGARSQGTRDDEVMRAPSLGLEHRILQLREALWRDPEFPASMRNLEAKAARVDGHDGARTGADDDLRDLPWDVLNTSERLGALQSTFVQCLSAAGNGKASRGRPGEESPQKVAAAGFIGAGSKLPFLEVIQRSFGGHDLGNVEAHVGGSAADAASALGAEAYASGSRIAFAGAPDLHTAAHEAAHVIQQRQGVSLSGGMGKAGDAYERHADAVADRVVRGESAELLLEYGENGARPSSADEAIVPVATARHARGSGVDANLQLKEGTAETEPMVSRHRHEQTRRIDAAVQGIFANQMQGLNEFARAIPEREAETSDREALLAAAEFALTFALGLIGSKLATAITSGLAKMPGGADAIAGSFVDGLKGTVSEAATAVLESALTAVGGTSTRSTWLMAKERALLYAQSQSAQCTITASEWLNDAGLESLATCLMDQVKAQVGIEEQRQSTLDAWLQYETETVDARQVHGGRSKLLIEFVVAKGELQVTSARVGDAQPQVVSEFKAKRKTLGEINIPRVIKGTVDLGHGTYLGDHECEGPVIVETLPDGSLDWSKSSMAGLVWLERLTGFNGAHPPPNPARLLLGAQLLVSRLDGTSTSSLADASE